MPPTPAPALQEAIVSLLRGASPRGDFDRDSIAACLRRYECGGYLHAAWSRAAKPLPSPWDEAIRGAYRKCSVDNLHALACLRALGRHLDEERIPFILLKGTSYMVDLYPDPGARAITDIDVMVRSEDVHRIVPRLQRADYRDDQGLDFGFYRRFQLWPPWEHACGIEFHCQLGLPVVIDLDQSALWDASVPCVLEGVACRRLAPADALLYHVEHAADHYFGPTLKWALDLREMLRQWRPDPEALLARAGAWRARLALHLALLQVDKLFPGEAPPLLAGRLAPAAPRRRSLDALLSPEPAEFLKPPNSPLAHYRRRVLMIDRPRDAVALCARVLVRPLTMRPRNPWTASSRNPRGAGDSGPAAAAPR